MLKSVVASLAVMCAAPAALMLTAAPTAAAPVGPHASVCAAGKPAVLARVTGLKARQGVLSVKLYASKQSTFLEKGAYLRKVEVPVNRSGPIDVCIPVPSSQGRYALAVRHEISGDKSRLDGGGFSGNPSLSLVDVALKRKPSISAVSFQVNGNTRVVPVVLNYIQGGSLRPVS